MNATPTSAMQQNIDNAERFSKRNEPLGYPGKGVGYDWQAVIAEVEASHLDLELAALEALPVE